MHFCSHVVLRRILLKWNQINVLLFMWSYRCRVYPLLQCSLISLLRRLIQIFSSLKMRCSAIQRLRWASISPPTSSHHKAWSESPALATTLAPALVENISSCSALHFMTQCNRADHTTCSTRTLELSIFFFCMCVCMKWIWMWRSENDRAKCKTLRSCFTPGVWDNDGKTNNLKLRTSFFFPLF